MKKKEDYYPIECNIVYTTPKAVLIFVGATPEEIQEDTEAGKYWLPMFCILEDIDQSWVGLEGVELNVTEKMLTEKGLV